MDLKKWAGNKMGDSAPNQQGAPPSPSASASGTPASGPKSVVNPELSSADLPPAMQQWAQVAGNTPEHPQGQPTWAADPTAYAHALALVKKDWPSYKEPWAAVAAAYNAMAGASRPAAPPMAPPGMPAPGAAPGMPMAPRSPAPGGGVPAGRPNPFGGAR